MYNLDRGPKRIGHRPDSKTDKGYSRNYAKAALEQRESPKPRLKTTRVDIGADSGYLDPFRGSRLLPAILRRQLEMVKRVFVRSMHS